MFSNIRSLITRIDVLLYQLNQAKDFETLSKTQIQNYIEIISLLSGLKSYLEDWILINA